MIPVYQTSFSNKDESIRGNCLWAAVSSITGIPLERFKGFEYLKDGAWFPPLWDILIEHDFIYQGMIRDLWSILDYSAGVDGYYIVCGGSPRGCPSGHAVVYNRGRMVHDPHPDGTGITSIEYAYMIERI